MQKNTAQIRVHKRHPIALKGKSDAIFVTQARSGAMDFHELLARESVILSAKARFAVLFENWNVVTFQRHPGISR